MSVENDPEFQRFKDRVERELVPKLHQSGLVISMVPCSADGVDVNFAVELGLSIMLDKPILAVIRPGTKISEKLSRVVDRFVELDLDDPDCSDRIRDAVWEIIAAKGGPP